MYRIGHGIDVHAFATDRDFFLGGIKIPYEKGLAGHSDADVVIHALCDSLLGAAGLGDIGCWFPDTDQKFKNIRSTILLEKVVNEVQKKEFKIVNIDITILAQSPKLNPYINDMRKTLSALLKIEKDAVNIKATTTEKMNAEGKGECISAQAICSLQLNS
jgi:2-C-methyl-D-erythritol 2,4-cyclodiphosphate synthase